MTQDTSQTYGKAMLTFVGEQPSYMPPPRGVPRVIRDAFACAAAKLNKHHVHKLGYMNDYSHQETGDINYVVLIRPGFSDLVFGPVGRSRRINKRKKMLEPVAAALKDQGLNFSIGTLTNSHGIQAVIKGTIPPNRCDL